MKHYKWLFMGILCGLLCFFTGERMGESINLSDIVLEPAFIGADYYPQYIVIISQWFMPLLVFQIIFGTYIYRHFCSAGIYFFSRNADRKKWFLKESAKLYVYALAYLACFLGSGILIQFITRSVRMDRAGFILLIYYLAIHSLFLFFSTLAVNILSVKFRSSVGFMIVMFIQIAEISCYSFFGNFIESKDLTAAKYFWSVKINPFAHLIFKMHSSKISIVNEIINEKGIVFDLNTSVIVFVIVTAIILYCGCAVCVGHEFISNNQEFE